MILSRFASPTSRSFLLNHALIVQVELITRQFKANQYLTFISVLTPLMAVVIYLRKNGYVVNLENLKLKKLIKIRDDLTLEPQPKRLVKLLKDITVEEVKFDCPELRSIYTATKSMDHKSVIRGKYDLWFILEFIKAFYKKYKGQLREDGRKIKQRTEISKNNIFTLLMPGVQYPTSLRDFISNQKDLCSL